MPTSSRFAVAVHLLAAIAANPDRPATSEQMAASASTNPAVVRKLLSMLAKAGLTCSRLGAGGGAMLAKPPDQISLHDVFRAVEEPRLFTLHRTNPDPGCWLGRHIQAVFCESTAAAQAAVEDQLAAVTIADIVDRVRGRAELISRERVA